ncbi:MAG: substrate-binding domain-containing protein [Notoacmeibacter sp.]|nr:substrate-binding domain-containing protein [Notoacmeibacter sp.]
MAVLVPMGGSAGIWGPSSISSAQLAIHEVNSRDGIGGQPVAPLFLNSDDSAAGALEHEVAALLEEQSIQAIVGMNVSSVRQRLNKVVRGRVPYIYTPLYEGNEHSPNVFAIGETPADQLQPAIRHLSRRLRVRRWALVGNDYVWPRTSHAVARASIAESGGTVTFDGYVPFGLNDAEWLVERIARTRAEIVLISLVGQDAVEFNRAFGQMDLDRRIFRFSTAMEENILMATGAENTKRLFAASSYFSSLATPENEEFKERYRAIHAGHPPALNALGQSLYEGIHFYSAMHEHRERGLNGPVRYRSARAGSFYSNDRKDMTIYLSRADGHNFSIIDKLP